MNSPFLPCLDRGLGPRGDLAQKDIDNCARNFLGLAHNGERGVAWRAAPTQSFLAPQSECSLRAFCTFESTFQIAAKCRGQNKLGDWLQADSLKLYIYFLLISG
jgi:hypothetical protein